MDEVAGAEYASLLNDLIDDAQKTKESLESRAAGVITTSAALVTLLFGLRLLRRPLGLYDYDARLEEIHAGTTQPKKTGRGPGI